MRDPIENELIGRDRLAVDIRGGHTLRIDTQDRRVFTLDLKSHAGVYTDGVRVGASAQNNTSVLTKFGLKGKLG